MHQSTLVTLATTLLATQGNPLYAAENTSATNLTWSPENVIYTKTISDVQLSPCNQSLLYVVTKPKIDEEKSILLSAIYKTDLANRDSFAISPKNSSCIQPRWSPNGEWIAFLSIEGGIKNLYLIPSTGGEPKALVQNKRDVQTFAWSPDGNHIALVMSDEKGGAKNQNPRSLAYVYDQNILVNRLWLIDVFATDLKLIALTSDQYCIRGSGDFGTINTEFDWSKDSKNILFAYSPSANFDDSYLDSSIAMLSLATREVHHFEKRALFEAMPRYSPDGQMFAFLSGNSPQKYSFDRQVAVCSTDEKHYTLLAKTFNEGPFISGANLLGWAQDAESLYFFEPKGTKYHLVQIPIDGSTPKEIDTKGLFFKEPTLSYDKTMLGCVVQATDIPPEAFVLKLNDSTAIQVSRLNENLLSYPKIRTEIISWSSPDGLTIEGLLTYPLNYVENKQYPLLTIVHGGPMAFFDETFSGTPHPYPIASFSEAGFFVFRPNPRGSTGYGKEFRCANYLDWGGADFIDIMSGIDHLIENGMIDPERLGIMGWSYGGFMTARAITQTNKFKAASIGAGCSNLISMNGTTDLRRFLPDYLGSPFDNLKLYEERSPINFLHDIETPCLIQHGTDDKRVPVTQAYELYHGLQQLGKKATLVLYPGMGHRIFDPKMQLDAMERNLQFFQEHLNPSMNPSIKLN